MDRPSLKNNCPRSLILAAHGSMAEVNTNEPLEILAHEIANKIQIQYPHGNFQRVTTAFLNSQPKMSEVLESLPPGDTVIVPVMSSNGYYLNKLPEVFRQNSNVDQFEIFITPVVGVHPSIPKLIADQIHVSFLAHEIVAAETTVVMVGHGTRRNSNSGDSTITLAKNVQNEVAGDLAELSFEVCFLDQHPDINAIAAQIKTRHVLIIPFLMGRGPHATSDIPNAFGLPSGPDIEFPLFAKTESGKCICSLPVGLYPDIADLCLELADEAIANRSPTKLFGPSNEQTAQSEGSLS